MKTLSLFILTSFFYILGISTLSAANWKVYVAKYKQDKTCAITYTFDDGLAEHSTVAAPELEKRGFRGTFWVCGFYTEQGASSKLPRMTWDELKQMAKNGHEISNHSWSHQNAKRLTLEQVKSEIEKNDSAILSLIVIHITIRQMRSLRWLLKTEWEHVPNRSQLVENLPLNDLPNGWMI